MRLTRGGNFVPGSRGKLFGGKHLKRRKNRETGPGSYLEENLYLYLLDIYLI